MFHSVHRDEFPHTLAPNMHLVLKSITRVVDGGIRTTHFGSAQSSLLPRFGRRDPVSRGFGIFFDRV